jgi:GAF domain-containing protein
MMLFFDTQYIYVLAEATQNLAIGATPTQKQDDGLWMGMTKTLRNQAMCELTTELPLNGGSNAMDPETGSLAHIVNDLQLDVRFNMKPFVTSGPRFRFYAGVPVTTAKGVNIGSFCIIDDKPRHGLIRSEVQFLQDMADATMSHLEMVRPTSKLISRLGNSVLTCSRYVPDWTLSVVTI